MAQLVVHFMRDPAAGLREMARVVKGGGVVAASVWDYGGKRDPLRQFWAAAHELDPNMIDGRPAPAWVRETWPLSWLEPASLAFNQRR